jgi:hypothetical protein
MKLAHTTSLKAKPVAQELQRIQQKYGETAQAAKPR